MRVPKLDTTISSAVAVAALVFLTVVTAVGVTVENLPLINPDVSAYLVSSHNKKGLNGDAGWFLYQDTNAQPDTLAGWTEVDKGATAAFTKDHARDSHGALAHTVRIEGLNTSWRSIRKELSGGINLDTYDRLSMYVWPTHADGGIDYGVRINNGGGSAELDIHDLQPGKWNHVVLDLGKTPRQGVDSILLLFNLKWGAVDGMQFFVDDISFLQKDGASFSVDDFERGRKRAVLFDAIGPGSIQYLWGLGGYDFHIEVDGRTIVNAPEEDFYSGNVPGFSLPMVRVSPVTAGPWHCVAHWSFIPIGFREHCRITTDHPLPFYQVIAEKYRDPSEVIPWSTNQDLSGLDRLWTIHGQDPKSWTDLQEKHGATDLKPGASISLADLQSAGAIDAIRIALPQTKALANSLWLTMSWDGHTNDVETPLGFFFGAGVRWQDIPSVCFGINGDEGYNFFPMPFWKSAHIRLENRGTDTVTNLSYRIDWRSKPYPELNTGYFHAFYHEGPTTRGRDWMFLNTEGRGQFVGVVQRLIGGHYCEGDIRFYLDGSRSPAFYGTGTEDYYDQGCWPNRDNHTPFHGCVGNVAEDAKQAGGGKTFYDFPACYYRVHLEAPIRFQNGIRCGIQHGGYNETDSQYASLAFCYVRPCAGLQQTDSIAFTGEGVESLTNFFEGNEDKASVACTIFKTTKPFTRTITIASENTGVRLRRVLDQAAGPQRADILVDGQPAGAWYDPDCNPYKRLAESEFELPPALVRGKSSIRVTFRPVGGAWTIGELRSFSHTVDLDKVTSN
jgi:hypothetical protein